MPGLPILKSIVALPEFQAQKQKARIIAEWQPVADRVRELSATVAGRAVVAVDTAIPAEVTPHDRAGAHTRALTYESGRRATWRRLHDAITGVDAVGWSLDGLADALAVAGRVLRRQGVGA